MPLKTSVCGLPWSLSVRLRLPVLAPFAPGVKVRLSVHVPPAASVVQLLVVITKSLLFVPVMAALVTVTEVVPLFVTVTVIGALVVPTVWVPKLTGDGDRVISVPLPLMAIVCGLAQALSVYKREALRLPKADGVNVTVTVQLLPTANDEPHVLEVML